MDSTQLREALQDLRRELARLGERLAALEAVAGTQAGTGEASVPTPAVLPSPPLVAAGLSEELVLVISAAIAAFFGKKPHIRQIRLLGPAPWAQQGRVQIQASHALPVHHSRSQP